VNRLVHSKTNSTLSSPHGSWRGIPLSKYPRRAAVDHQAVARELHVSAVTAADRVELERVREIVSGRDVFDGDDIKASGVEELLEQSPSDTAEVVDRDLHGILLFILLQAPSAELPIRDAMQSKVSSRPNSRRAASIEPRPGGLSVPSCSQVRLTPHIVRDRAMA
jgi:hypothetical protein